MTRQIPAALQDHLDGAVHTLAYLLKITAKDGTSFGVTSHDQDIVYDDGEGDVTYATFIGVQQASLASDSALAVTNTEATLLIADSGSFTEEQINAGALDFADFVVYRVNWKDLTQGHFIVQAGTSGIVRSLDGLEGVIELRGLTQQLRQTFVELYSVTCRAVFGSQGSDAVLPCLFDATSLWGNYTVASVGSESDRDFTTTVAPSVSGPNGALPFVPGLIQFLTGDNANHYTETEAVAGASIQLRFPTPYAIQVGDTLRIRPDCAKRWQEDCIDKYDNASNFRGEPLIPIIGREV